MDIMNFQSILPSAVSFLIVLVWGGLCLDQPQMRLNFPDAVCMSVQAHRTSGVDLMEESMKQQERSDNKNHANEIW